MSLRLLARLRMILGYVYRFNKFQLPSDLLWAHSNWAFRRTRPSPSHLELELTSKLQTTTTTAIPWIVAAASTARLLPATRFSPATSSRRIRTVATLRTRSSICLYSRLRADTRRLATLIVTEHPWTTGWGRPVINLR